MGASGTTGSHAWKNSAASAVKATIERERQAYWRQRDFPQLPPGAVSQALSRLAREGFLDRVSKGIYYNPRQTRFGKSQPSTTAIQRLSSKGKRIFPAGVHAANLLGFTTQNALNGEFATSANSLPKALTGQRAKVHTRRPREWNELTETEESLLDLLRQRARTSELPPQETIERLLELFRQEGRFERLARMAQAEPPRVRAMLGAIGEELGEDPDSLTALRNSLNPLSRFDFGQLGRLRYAGRWQAKGSNEKRGADDETLRERR
ncbi:MAG: hypothetical protein IH608_05945, partial [Proteobacteria bacterium]|nr:hypothetical protein [Pseudomonadota bacterium]